VDDGGGGVIYRVFVRVLVGSYGPGTQPFQPGVSLLNLPEKRHQCKFARLLGELRETRRQTAIISLSDYGFLKNTAREHYPVE
jgi:hypothetical protein